MLESQSFNPSTVLHTGFDTRNGKLRCIQVQVKWGKKEKLYSNFLSAFNFALLWTWTRSLFVCDRWRRRSSSADWLAEARWNAQENFYFLHSTRRRRRRTLESHHIMLGELVNELNWINAAAVCLYRSGVAAASKSRYSQWTSKKDGGEMRKGKSEETIETFEQNASLMNYIFHDDDEWEYAIRSSTDTRPRVWSFSSLFQFHFFSIHFTPLSVPSPSLLLSSKKWERKGTAAAASTGGERRKSEVKSLRCSGNCWKLLKRAQKLSLETHTILIQCSESFEPFLSEHKDLSVILITLQSERNKSIYSHFRFSLDVITLSTGSRWLPFNFRPVEQLTERRIRLKHAIGMFKYFSHTF